MHEMAYAVAVVDAVRRVAEREQAAHVSAVEVEMGALLLIEPDALQAAWEAARIGTVAAEAELTLRETAAQARCRACGATFAPRIELSYECPRCGAADAEIVAGREVLLRRVTCDVCEQDPVA